MMSGFELVVVNGANEISFSYESLAAAMRAYEFVESLAKFYGKNTPLMDIRSERRYD